MRIPRRILLSQDGGIVHKFWRVHDKKYLLAPELVKKMYLRHTLSALSHKSAQGQVQINAYCVMDNHSHQIVSYKSQSEYFSNFMRIGHSGFGAEFNRLNKREGAVASGRPKTPLIQPGSTYHQIKTQFYVEANPLRAGKVKNLMLLKLYKFSSYRYYAWGIKDEFTKNLTPSQWYLKLGKTPKQRQAKYRSLFDQYLKELLIHSPIFVTLKFIGDPIWCSEQFEKAKESFQKLKPQNQNAPPA